MSHSFYFAKFNTFFVLILVVHELVVAIRVLLTMLQYDLFVLSCFFSSVLYFISFLFLYSIVVSCNHSLWRTINILYKMERFKTLIRPPVTIVTGVKVTQVVPRLLLLIEISTPQLQPPIQTIPMIK
jgi:hypothetical protein